MSSARTRDYALAPALRMRLLGILATLCGLVVLVVTVVAVWLRPPASVVLGLVVLAALGALAIAVLLGRRWYVVRLDDTGYQVRFVRGVGAPRARWADVADLATSTTAGSACVLLRLRDGRATTIPVNLIEGDREEFVDELQRRLDAGHGYRRR